MSELNKIPQLSFPIPNAMDNIGNEKIQDWNTIVNAGLKWFHAYGTVHRTCIPLCNEARFTLLPVGIEV